jgi:OmpA-OmpF porin, OOP family
MSKKTSYILGILATILIGTFLYYTFCCPECCKQETDVPNATPTLTDTAGIGDYKNFNLSGKDLSYSCHDNFRFLTNGFNNTQPVNDSINTGIGLLKTYFDKNAKDKLVITGYALNSEKNTSAFPNLALARANDIKSYFVSKGIASDRFELKGELRDAWKTSADTLLGPADFRIMQAEEVATEKVVDWVAKKDSLNANPLILYFNTNQSEINLSAEERQKVANIVNYLDNVADAKLSATGHTDSEGNRDQNVTLGLNRANFAKEYLSKNGVTGNKIETSSKGPDEPIADNKTAEGKSKNRRTVVTIK